MSESHFRLIPRLDIKAPNLVKGVRLEGFRVVGSPAERAKHYYDDGADELYYQDIVASLYQRNSLLDLVERTATSIFVPLLVGGGLRSVHDVREALRSGADRVAINTALVANPSLLTEATRIFGVQCMAVTVEVVRQQGWWEVLTDCGRELTGMNALEWIDQCSELGAGEIVLTSVDRDGTRQGFDLDLLEQTLSRVTVPVIIHGGARSSKDLIAAANCGASGAAIASILHHDDVTISSLKRDLHDAGIPVRL